jgi:ligand-binding sensor protein
VPGLAAGLFFRQVLASPEFAEFALILKRLTGLSMALNTPGVDVTRTSLRGDSGNPLCRLIRGTPAGARRCEACDRRQHARAGAAGEARLYTCHAGFYDMAIPVRLLGQHLATISSGQVLVEPPSAAGFARWRRRLPWLAIPETRLRQAYDRAPWMPRSRLWIPQPDALQPRLSARRRLQSAAVPPPPAGWPEPDRSAASRRAACRRRGAGSPRGGRGGA